MLNVNDISQIQRLNGIKELLTKIATIYVSTQKPSEKP